LAAWRDALLEAIARGRCVNSRGRINPRGVKRKRSNFNARHRGLLLPTRSIRRRQCFVSEQY